jgi:hypothetical protein
MGRRRSLKDVPPCGKINAKRTEAAEVEIGPKNKSKEVVK